MNMKAYVISHMRKPMEVDVINITDTEVTLQNRIRERTRPNLMPESSYFKTKAKAIEFLNQTIDDAIQKAKDDIKRLRKIKKDGGRKRNFNCHKVDDKSFKNLNLTETTIFYETGISVRVLNALHYLPPNDQGEEYSYKVPLSYFKHVRKTDILRCRHMGVKSANEIERMLAEANIQLL